MKKMVRTFLIVPSELLCHTLSYLPLNERTGQADGQSLPVRCDDALSNRTTTKYERIGAEEEEEEEA